nr:Chain C, LEU-ALA-LEU-LEU-THR-GLY-VAL-ARG-TRP [synthetic construct]
LALLTGVRW